MRVRRGKPTRGEWQPTEDSGWQHGEIPEPPGGLRDSSLATWQTWFQAWWAAHWTPEDLPALRLLIRLYDRVNRGDLARLSELRQLMDSYGITPKGQQDRRWLRPDPPRREPAVPSPYAHLRVTGDWPSNRERWDSVEYREERAARKARLRAAVEAPTSRRDPRLQSTD
jgi:hypothetical protein